MTDSTRPAATILLIEDNPADQEMTRRAMARTGANVVLEVVDDGEQAMDYLLGAMSTARWKLPRRTWSCST